MKPIKYFQNDELSGLVKSYNKMIYQIEDQKMLLANKEREEAWRNGKTSCSRSKKSAHANEIAHSEF